MNKYNLLVLADAEQDLLDIYRYVAETDSVAKAEYLLTKLETLCLSLQLLPERGHIPEELRRLAMTNYREIHFKPYRVFYQILEKEVYIHCIIDGRRDLETLLLKRLIK